MSPVIMFVDDEPNVLDALRERLHGYPASWTLLFADSGETALARLEAVPVDIVVADLHMPGMDGVAFLTRVRERYPYMVCILFSGYADHAYGLRAMGVAHQFIEKPCPPGVLEETLESVCRVQAIISDRAVRRVIHQADPLPSRPRVYHQLQRCLADGRSATGEVAAIIEQDVALSGRLLELVNSAFFRHAQSISNIKDAVAYLGLRTIRDLSLAAGVFNVDHSPRGYPGMSLDSIARRSTRVAVAAAGLMQDSPMRDDAFVAGLLHDIGLLVLMTGARGAIDNIVDVQDRTGCSLQDAESDVLGGSHAGIGAGLLGLWGLAWPIIDAVATHHQPPRIKESQLDIATAVRVAVCIESEAEGEIGDNAWQDDSGILAFPELHERVVACSRESSERMVQAADR